MIVLEAFIWYKDHYVIHITDEKNISSIIEKGLLPMNSERCKSINDTRKGIFCLDSLYKVQDWAEVLYKDYNLETLKLLRLNLKRRKWELDNNEVGFGLYLLHKVPSNKLDYLEIKDEHQQILPITKLFDLDFLYQIHSDFDHIETGKEIKIDNCTLSWQPLNNYPPEKHKVKSLTN